jgi:hypothetical protein
MALKSYRFINERLVRELSLQLGLDTEIEKTIESSVNGGISGFGASRNKSRKSTSRTLDDPRLLSEIMDGLREHGQLKIYRPERKRDLPPYTTFVHEVNIEGQPVYLPVKDDSGVPPGIAGLTIWVLEPIGTELGFIDSEPDGSWAWDWIGTYVFLVEEHLADPERKYFHSGISALRLIVDVTAGYDHSPRGMDRYGRDNPAHPIEKLRSVGGVTLRPRQIETVYRIARMTDEQASTINGKQIRLNDIMAYPLYIADS